MNDGWRKDKTEAQKINDDFKLYYENKGICEKVVYLLNKDCCEDIFYSAVIDGHEMYKPQIWRRRIQFKFS